MIANTSRAHGAGELASAARQQLLDRFSDQISFNRDVRERHGRGESWHPSAPPDAVLFASSTADVVAAVRICAAHDLPIVPFGVGTSVEGHVTAPRGGLSVDLHRMGEVLRVSAEDADCTVQAGVTRKQLNHYLRDTGLFFPIDPGADATIGGMVATRASGTNAVRYGTMREAVLGLEVVLASGEVIKTGGRVRKSAAGYDLTRLFVGSEGTLGIVTEVTLRLHPVPAAISSAVCSFPTLEGAVGTVVDALQSGVGVARIELLDELQMAAINRFSRSSHAELPTLFLEFHGSNARVSEDAQLVQGLASGHGGTDFRWASSTEERSALWQARHDAYYAALALRPGSEGWPTDVCVPISALADCIKLTRDDLANCGLFAPIMGHVGDGNFHVILTVDPANDSETEKAHAFAERLVERALGMGGTCTGEHGIGMGKRQHLLKEHAGAVGVMKAIKDALDPSGLLNPGKIFAEQQQHSE